jgi:ammonia channel protein AmtB
MNTEVGALTVTFTEFYYWVCVVLMFLIHTGFCLYEVGVSRQKNMMHTLMKNAVLIPLITITFFFFGWWIYSALPNGPGITGGLVASPWAEPWSELMGPHLGGRPHSEGLTAAQTATWARLNGVFWGAFVLFSCTAGSILSGAAIERIRAGAFWLFAVLVGSVTWVIGAAWGWSPAGWMVQVLGYHDSYAAGIIHGLCGGSALAILIHLGARVGRFRADGEPRVLPPHNTWMVIIGLFLIYTGFWGFYASCNIPIADLDPSETRTFYGATTIYGTATTLSAITFNFLMSLSGGFLAAYMISRGDPYWTFSGGLAGIIATSPANDLYHPYQALLIGAFTVFCLYKLHYWVERRFKIDDAVGAVAVHGYAGTIGVILSGFVLWGYPSSPNPAYPRITPWGQAIGAAVLFLGLGFIPCYLLGFALKRLGMLRIPLEVELAGLDHAERLAAGEQAEEILETELQAAEQRKAVGSRQ